MHFVEISIPGDIDPLERGERFEDPIMEALEGAGINFEWLGGGSALGEVDGRMVVTGCDFDFEVDDLKRSLAIIVQVLKAADAPADTSIRVGEEEETVYRLGDLP
jgi:hypothetical protein